MADLILLVVVLFSSLVLFPANLVAKYFIAKSKKIEFNKVTLDDSWVLSWIICIPTYIILWWLSEVTGLRELFYKQFK